MQAKGYTFTTISGVMEQQNGGAAQAAGAVQPGGVPNGQAAGEAGGTAEGQAGAQVSASDRLQAAHREATGATLYEGKALIVAVAVAEWTVPTLSVGLVVVGVAVIGRFGMMLILARRHYRQRNRRRFSWGPSRSPNR